MRARRALAVTAKAYGYRGRESADYLKKDPASVSGYLRGEHPSSDLKNVVKLLEERMQNVNSKV